MKYSLGTALISAALVLAAPQSARAWSLDFIILNSTNEPVVRLWASPSNNENWGTPFDNVLVAENGGRQKVSFNSGGYDEDTCTFDFKVQFSGGAVRYWEGYNLCQITGIRLYVQNGQVKAQTW